MEKQQNQPDKYKKQSLTLEENTHNPLK